MSHKKKNKKRDSFLIGINVFKNKESKMKRTGFFTSSKRQDIKIKTKKDIEEIS